MRKLLLPLLIILLLFPSCSRDKEAEGPLLILSYADNQPADHPATLAAAYFASLAEERTEGRVSIEVYSNGELGAEDSVYLQMKYGGIDFSRFSAGVLADYYPMLALIELPFLYRDSGHMWRVLDGRIGEGLLEAASAELGVIGLSWLDAGARSFYTREPVGELSGLEGLRIRIQETAVMESFVKPLGVVPVRMDYGDVYSALVKNIIDGAENNLPSYYSMGHYLAAKYVYMDEHCRLPEMLAMSTRAREKLEAAGEGLYETVVECAKEAALYERELWKEDEDEALRKVLEAGSVVTYPSQQDMDRARELMTSVYEEYSAYSEIISLIQSE